MNKITILVYFLLFSTQFAKEFGIFFKEDESYLQTDYITFCDDSAIKFEVLINRTSGIVMFAENKVRSIKLIAYFERPGMYINVTDGPYKYNLPLTLDFFSNVWYGWHEVEMKFTEEKLSLKFDNTERQALLQGKHLFPEDLVEDNKVYLGSGPQLPNIGNLSRFSGLIKNIRYRSCGCNEWKPIKIIKTVGVSMERQGDCASKDSCNKECSCYLFEWGGKRCDCPEEPCAETNNHVWFGFDRADATLGRLVTFNDSGWNSTEKGPYRHAVEINPKNSLALYVLKGRTCFKNVFLCENGFAYNLWLLPEPSNTNEKSILIMKHSLSIDSLHGLTLQRMTDYIEVSFTSPEGATLKVKSSLTLSIWSLVTITYNQTHLSLYINSYLKDSSNRFINLYQKLLDLSSSTRFLFIGNNKDYPKISIENFHFSTNISINNSPSIQELKFEQHSNLRKTNTDCSLIAERTTVDLTNCYRSAFGVSKLTEFYISLIININSKLKVVLVQSNIIHITIDLSNILIVDLPGRSKHYIKLHKTINNLYYIEISLNKDQELVIFQNIDILLLDMTLNTAGKDDQSYVQSLKVFNDFNVLRVFRIMNRDRVFASRTLRVLTKNFPQYFVDFEYNDTGQSNTFHLTEGYVDQGLLLTFPTLHVSNNWFQDSCIKYVTSCYHGMTLTFWIKIINDFKINSNGKYFQIFSSGKKGISLMLERQTLYFIITLKSQINFKFIPTSYLFTFDKWYYLEISLSQNQIPFLYLNGLESQRINNSEDMMSWPNLCKEICLGDKTSTDNSIKVIIDELKIFDAEREFLYANEYLSSELSGHKLISFTQYQLNQSFALKGSAKLIFTKFGYALGLNNFGPRFATLNLTDEPKCFWDINHCRRGIFIRLLLRPDNLAISEQTVLASSFLTVTLNLEYIVIQIRTFTKSWLIISKDIIQLFTWQMVDISWREDTGLKVYINGKLTGHAKIGTERIAGMWRITPFMSVGIDYQNTGNINYATLVIEDIELFEADRSNLAYERNPIDDLFCVLLFNFDGNSKIILKLILGVSGNAGIFQSNLTDAIKFPIPKCFNSILTRCKFCYTLRLWINIYKLNMNVLNADFLTLSVMSGKIIVKINDIITEKRLTFVCQHDNSNLLMKWNFIEISWDPDEGLLMFINREEIVCNLESMMSGQHFFLDFIEISEDFEGAIDEIEMYHARISVLYWTKTLDESKVLLIINKIKEKEKIDKEVFLLKKALHSESINRTIEVIESFQFNGSNYVSYKLPSNTYTYIPGGKEEVEISFMSYNSIQSSIIWISDSKLSKNAISLKNNKLYFTKVYILQSSNTSRRLTEQLEIHDNILPNILYNVVICQRAGEITMKTTSLNQSYTQSMIGRDPLLPMDSNIYFGGYNNENYLQSNQLNSSLFGLIYKAQLKSGSSEKVVDIFQEMSNVKKNPNIVNYGNVTVIKKVLKTSTQQKTSFLATLSYLKIPLMINNPFFSLRLPKWDFNLLTSIEIEFTTFESQGIMLFIGNITDFITLEIFDSQLFFIYKHQKFFSRIKTNAPTVTVSDNKVYSVYLGRDLSGNIKVYFNRDEVIDYPMNLTQFANSVSVLGHLGKYEFWPREIMSRTSFLGCINFVRINDADYLNFTYNTFMMKYSLFNLYGNISKNKAINYSRGVCEVPAATACQGSPCSGGWCQLTQNSVSGEFTNNFKCNCLYSSKSKVIQFTGNSPIDNFNIWMNEYLMQGRSRPCIEDTKQLLIVSQSFLTINFQITFPFVSVLDLEFLVSVKSKHNCIMDLSFQQSSMFIIISEGQLLINISKTNIISLSSVNLDDKQWHGLQIQVRLQSIHIRIGQFTKDFKSSLIPDINISSIKIGNCANYHQSHFIIKNINYNNLPLLNSIPKTENMFFTKQYHQPIIKEFDFDQLNTFAGSPVTFLNNFQEAITSQPIIISWFTQFRISFTGKYPGLLFYIQNGLKLFLCIRCDNNDIIFIHKDRLLKAKTEREKFNSENIRFVVTLDLIREKVILKKLDSNQDKVLLLGIDSWNVGDSINLKFGLNYSNFGMINIDEFDNDEQECLKKSLIEPVFGCLESFLWSDGNETVSYNDKWRTLMKTSPENSVEFEQCKVIEKCFPDTCLNGVCESPDHFSTYCNCSNTDFTGNRCHQVKDKCLYIHCLNNGKCVSTKDYRGMDHVYCNCSGTGYFGKSCEQIQCDDDFCSNNGTCYISNNTRLCDCSSTKFSGHKCNVPVCKASTCGGRGFCRIFSNTSAPICHCFPEFFGDTCEETFSNKCQTICKNSGVCSLYNPIFKLCSNKYCQKTNSFTCNCDHTLYQGDMCEQAEFGFLPLKDGVLIMENVTLTKHNYLRILFETKKTDGETTLVTILKSINEQIKLCLVDRTLMIRYINHRRRVSSIQILGTVIDKNVLLLIEHDSQVDFYFNKKIGNLQFFDSELKYSIRYKRDVPLKTFHYPAIIGGCNEEMVNCFRTLIGGFKWNDRFLIDKRNKIWKNGELLSVDTLIPRSFPSQTSFIMFLDGKKDYIVPLGLAITLIVAIFIFYIIRKRRSKPHEVNKVYINNRQYSGLDTELVEAVEFRPNYNVPDSSPELSSLELHDSRLIAKSISSSVSSEFEYCRILIVKDLKSVNKLSVVDYTPVPEDQIVIVVSYIPEIEIYQNVFPSHSDDKLYKCNEVGVSSIGHFIYCKMSLCQTVNSEAFELQAWKIGTPYKLITRPPNVIFTHSMTFNDESYRILILNSIASTVSLFEMESSTVLWSNSLISPYPKFIEPLLIINRTMKLIINRDLYFNIVDINEGTFVSTHVAPSNVRYRQIVNFDDNRLIILTDKFDLYHWNMEADFYDHRQLPKKITIVTKAFSKSENSIALGVETGEVYLSKDDNGEEYQILGPQNSKNIVCLKFSTDGGFLAAGFENNVIHIWNLESETAICHFYAAHDRGIIKELDFTSDNKNLIVGVLIKNSIHRNNKKILIINTNYDSK